MRTPQIAQMAQMNEREARIEIRKSKFETRRARAEFGILNFEFHFPRRCLLSAYCLLPTAFCLLLFTACGYHVAGRGDLLPPDIKTVAVPAFKNSSSTFRIEQQVTDAVRREFLERTNFRVTPNPTSADAIVRGTVKGVYAGVITFDPSTGRASSMQIQVLADVSLEDLHDHKILFSNPNYTFREEYQISQTTSGIFQENKPALERISSDLARTLVTDILENF